MCARAYSSTLTCNTARLCSSRYASIIMDAVASESDGLRKPRAAKPVHERWRDTERCFSSTYSQWRILYKWIDRRSTRLHVAITLRGSWPTVQTPFRLVYFPHAHFASLCYIVCRVYLNLICIFYFLYLFLALLSFFPLLSMSWIDSIESSTTMILKWWMEAHLNCKYGVY